MVLERRTEYLSRDCSSLLPSSCDDLRSSVSPLPLDRHHSVKESRGCSCIQERMRVYVIRIHKKLSSWREGQRPYPPSLIYTSEVVELFFDDLFDDLRDRTTHLILEVRAIRLVAGDADLRKFDTQGAFVESKLFVLSAIKSNHQKSSSVSVEVAVLLGSEALKPAVVPNKAATSSAAMSPVSTAAELFSATSCTPTSLRDVP